MPMQSTEEARKTPLYALHAELGGRLVPFAGYWLPVQYETGVIAEHKAVRSACGLFDVSHMGEVALRGPGALDTLQRLLCNDMSGMTDGQVRYSPMLNYNGGVVDDVLVYRFGEEDYLVVVNAANHDKDVAWMRAALLPGAALTDRSDELAQLALQGPKAGEILRRLLPDESIPRRYYHFLPDVTLDGAHCILSRTGYTGEDGFELYMPPADAERIARLLLQTGKPDGLIPCGLGCRDTLRLEAGMPLYGHEMDETVSPLDTGLDRYVKLDKGDFIGRDALLDSEPERVRIGLAVMDRGVVREHQDVYYKGKLVGKTTSGTYCPTVGTVAMALVSDEVPTGLGSRFQVDVRGQMLTADAVPLPFYRRDR